MSITAGPSNELHVCLNSCIYSSIQAALDSASPGTIIKVAQGVYTDVNTRILFSGPTPSSVVSQVVYVNKPVTIQGGYTTTNWTTSYPLTQTTTLDAGGVGRVVYITGDISPTISGLNIRGGNAAGLGGDYEDRDAGGGVYVITATASFIDNQISDNIATTGGGLYLHSSDAILTDNLVFNNEAISNGGAIFLQHSNATLASNTFVSNVARDWHGGGIFLNYSDAVVYKNKIISNTAIYNGGGLSSHRSAANINGNTFISNTASWGGGLFLYYSDDTWITQNEFHFNKTHPLGSGLGGGICLMKSDARLINNIVTRNTAKAGSGVYIEDSSPWLAHMTIAYHKTGDGSGVHVTSYEYDDASSPTVSNTILADNIVGITVTTNNTITLEATLWSNDTDWGGAGFVTTGTLNIWGDPNFIDPEAGNYHLKPGSLAIDAGVDAGVETDIDGDRRPIGISEDVGADECWAYLFLPLTVRSVP